MAHTIDDPLPGAPRPSERRHRLRPEVDVPGERLGLPVRRLAAAYALAAIVPALLAAAMIPLRSDHGSTTAIVLVVPVVAIGVLGATGPAVVAAVSAGLAYDVFLTEPYYRLAIDDADDVVAAVTLLVVGLVVGVLSSRVVRFGARANARRTELRHLVDFTNATTGPFTVVELTDAACAHISAVLDLSECRWSPEPHDMTSPLLMPDGNIMGYMSALNPDRAKLPEHLELPAMAGGSRIGHFVLTARQTRLASYEERLTAATIASLFASTVARDRPTVPPATASG